MLSVTFAAYCQQPIWIFFKLVLEPDCRQRNGGFFGLSTLNHWNPITHDSLISSGSFYKNNKGLKSELIGHFESLNVVGGMQVVIRQKTEYRSQDACLFTDCCFPTRLSTNSPAMWWNISYRWPSIWCVWPEIYMLWLPQNLSARDTLRFLYNRWEFGLDIQWERYNYQEF
jgi:hypothetical protein